MENQDTLFNQFKEAAKKAETKDFPGMDKVWSRVDEKLNTKVLVKKSNLWRKVAVAASVVAVISIGYQFLKPTTEIITPIELPQNTTIVQEQVEEPKTATKNPSEIIKEDAEKILKKQITAENAVAATPAVEEDKVAAKEEIKTDDSEKNNSNYILRGKVFDAIGVHHTTADTVKINPNGIAKIVPPLVVVDGKKSEQKTLSKMNSEDIETIVYLKEPLYIINGIHYSEEDLFGQKPMSPYAPLDQQEITKIIVLQDEEAIEKYGDKGKKGVIIITTKTGKPASPK